MKKETIDNTLNESQVDSNKNNDNGLQIMVYKMMKNDKKKKSDNKKDKTYWIAIWMCVGISVGTAIGAATNNMGLWMPIGLSLGSCIGVVFSNGKDSNDKDQKVSRI